MLLCHTIIAVPNFKLSRVNVKAELLFPSPAFTISHGQWATSSFQAPVIVIVWTNGSIFFVQDPFLATCRAALFDSNTSIPLLCAPFTLLFLWCWFRVRPKMNVNLLIRFVQMILLTSLPKVVLLPVHLETARFPGEASLMLVLTDCISPSTQRSCNLTEIR